MLRSVKEVPSFAPEAILIDQTVESPADPPNNGGYFELYQDSGNKYRWSLKIKDGRSTTQRGKLISNSTQRFLTKEEALRDVLLVREQASDAILLDTTVGGDTGDQAPYYLGVLPPELTIHWPAPPQIDGTVEITTSPDDGVMRLEQGRTRFIIAASLERLTLAASDMEVQVNEGIHVAKLFIEKGLGRLFL